MTSGLMLLKYLATSQLQQTTWSQQEFGLCCSTAWRIRAGLEKPQLTCPSEGFPLPGCPVWLPRKLLAQPSSSGAGPGQHLQPHIWVAQLWQLHVRYLFLVSPGKHPFDLSPQCNCREGRVKTWECLVPCVFMGSVMAFWESKELMVGVRWGCPDFPVSLCGLWRRKHGHEQGKRILALPCSSISVCSFTLEFREQGWMLERGHARKTFSLLLRKTFTYN